MFNIKDEELLKIFADNNDYIIYCFGKSVFSQMIMAMTKIENNEQVPSHVFIKSGKMIMESSTEEFRNGTHKINSGVRFYRVEDFLDNESTKKTEYRVKKIKLNEKQKNCFNEIINSDYSYETIEDYLFGRNKKRNGKFICSGAVEYILDKLRAYPRRQPSPAQIYREYGYDKI